MRSFAERHTRGAIRGVAQDAQHSTSQELPLVSPLQRLDLQEILDPKDHGLQKYLFSPNLAKHQNIIEGHKPYWAILHKGSLSLYYDATLAEKKDEYYMMNVSGLETVGKFCIQFVEY